MQLTINRMRPAAVLGAIMILLFPSCRKFIEVDAPPTSTSADIVFSTDATAAAVMTSIYASMASQIMSSVGQLTTLSLYPELSADNFGYYDVIGGAGNPALLYYQNKLGAQTIAQGAASYWNAIYPIVYKLNAAIQGASASTTLTPALQSQLLGEAYFMRAFCYFYLVNLYGNVPLALTTDYKLNSSLSRTSVNQVYDQIKADLLQAQPLLSDNYLDGSLLKPTAERVRPTQSAANALLARVYLYTADYVNAELTATNVISKKATYDTIPTEQMFLKNSMETIWALQPVGTGENTKEALYFITPSTGPVPAFPVYLKDPFVNSFEAGDRRRTNWIGQVTSLGVSYPYPAKYKVNLKNAAVIEYSIVLRLAEQYLIRAEARAQQNNATSIADAQKDLNAIRRRSGLPNTTASTKETLLTAILQERRWEFFAEWGHRWLDLKRTGKVDEVMSVVTPQKGGIWKTEYQLYPVPQQEMNLNVNLKQNPEY